MNKLSVTPIGTCRINTPLKRAQSRFPIEINLKRNYGDTQTSDDNAGGVMPMAVWTHGTSSLARRTSSDSVSRQVKCCIQSS